MNARTSNLQIENSPQEFLARISSLISGNETKYNLFCGLLNHALNAESPSEIPLMGTFGTSESIQLAFLQTPGRNLILIGEDNGNLGEFVSQLYSYVPQIPGVMASRTMCEIFAEDWCQLSGKKFNIDMRQWVYELRDLVATRSCEGQFRMAEPKDLEWLTDSAQAFHNESIPYDSFDYDKFKQVITSFIEKQRICLWEIGQKRVSMGMLMRPYRDIICISLVYTLPEFRNRGIALALTHALCLEACRQNFNRIVLYTDQNNSPSNHVYQKLGFVQIGEGLMGRFVQ